MNYLDFEKGLQKDRELRAANGVFGAPPNLIGLPNPPPMVD